MKKIKYDAEALDRMITESGVSIMELHRRTGLSRSSIYDLMNVEKSVLTLDHLIKIAEACKMNPKDYFPSIDEDLGILNATEAAHKRPAQTRKIKEMIAALGTTDADMGEELTAELTSAVMEIIEERDAMRSKLLNFKRKLSALR